MVDLVFREAIIFAVHANYDSILDFKSTGKTVADSIEKIIFNLPCLHAEYTNDGWLIMQDRELTEQEREYIVNDVLAVKEAYLKKSQNMKGDNYDH